MVEKKINVFNEKKEESVVFRVSFWRRSLWGFNSTGAGGVGVSVRGQQAWSSAQPPLNATSYHQNKLQVCSAASRLEI